MKKSNVTTKKLISLVTLASVVTSNCVTTYAIDNSVAESDTSSVYSTVEEINYKGTTVILENQVLTIYGEDGIAIKFDLVNKFINTYNPEIKKIVIKGNVDCIHMSAFSNMYTLEEVIFDTPVRAIYPSAFENCVNLKAVTFSDGVKTISTNAFKNCKSLTELTIPASVESIGYSAFEDCEELMYVNYTGTTPYIAPTAFKNTKYVLNCYMGDFIIMGGDVLYGLTPECNKSMTSISIPEDIRIVSSFMIDKIYIQKLDNLRYVYLPKNLERIGESAFSNCTKIESVENLENVKYIDSFAFSMCSNLKGSLTLNADIIGDSVFAECSSITNITLTGNVKELTNTFQGCLNLSSIKLPSSLISLSANTLRGTQIEEIVIPQNVTNISPNCFEDCNKLNRIVFLDVSNYIGNDIPEIITNGSITNIAFENISYYDFGKLNNVIANECKNNSEIVCEFVATNNDMLIGDANTDSKIDIRDITAINQHLLNMRCLTDSGLINSDIVSDGVIDIKDLVKLKKYVIKEITSL